MLRWNALTQIPPVPHPSSTLTRCCIQVSHTDGKARRGQILFGRGGGDGWTAQTPCFMAVGTMAAVQTAPFLALSLSRLLACSLFISSLARSLISLSFLALSFLTSFPPLTSLLDPRAETWLGGEEVRCEIGSAWRQVRSLGAEDLRECHVDILLSNTFHLML
eukprot:1208831-Rhodomonas_salina.1